MIIVNTNHPLCSYCVEHCVMCGGKRYINDVANFLPSSAVKEFLRWPRYLRSTCCT